MTKLIGICGKMRHGKDSCGLALTSVGFKQIAFADPIREAALLLNPIVSIEDPTSIHKLGPLASTFVRLADLVKAVGWEIAKANAEVRRILVNLGTEVGRDLFPWYETVDGISRSSWTQIAHDRMSELRLFAAATHSEEPRFVITDVRFPDEGSYIKEQGGLLLYVQRPSVESSSSHVSESMEVASMSDITIHNTGTLEDLQRAVLQACGFQLQEILE